jgi:hypothetical protein
MNLITIQNNFSNAFNNWVNSRQIPDIIDEFTYDQYENNPFRKTFNEDEIKTKELRIGANTMMAINAEVFSAFTNPYYLGHKFIHIPTYYKNAVNLYKSSSPATLPAEDLT